MTTAAPLSPLSSPLGCPHPMTTIKSIRPSWHAPGYRDPELNLVTEAGEIHIRLLPEAFVQLHNLLAEAQGVIDRSGEGAIDAAAYPYTTTHASIPRRKLRTLNLEPETLTATPMTTEDALKWADTFGPIQSAPPTGDGPALVALAAEVRRLQRKVTHDHAASYKEKATP